MELMNRTSSRLALALAAGLLMTGSALTSAKAADLGGDCCTDLEERVAALEATTVTHGTRKMSLKISGWVNAAMLFWNDNGDGADNRDAGFHDHNSGFYVVNTSTAQSRFSLEGSAKVREDLSAGFSISVRPWGDKLSDVTQINANPTENNVDIRDTYVFLDFKHLGKFQLGQQASAADSAWYQDLGGSSTWISNINPGAWGSSFYLRDVNGDLSTLQWGALLGELSDAQAPRLAYYSRQVDGFQAAASVGSQTWALALYYAQKYGTVSVSAGVGYDVSYGSAALVGQNVGAGLVDAGDTRLAKLGASGSIYESRSGLYGTAGYSLAASDVDGRNDATNAYGKLGWRRNVNGMGETNLYGEYDRTSQALNNDVNAHVLGVGLTQDIDATASVLYLGYRHATLETDVVGGSLIATSKQGSTCGCSLDPAATVAGQNFDAVMGGMVVQF